MSLFAFLDAYDRFYREYRRVCAERPSTPEALQRHNEALRSLLAQLDSLSAELPRFKERVSAGSWRWN